MTEPHDTVGRAPVAAVPAADPVAEARTLAAQIDGDAVGDLPSAEREVRIRVEAGRRALGGDPGADQALLTRGESIRLAATSAPPISDEDVAELQRLASDLARASRIRTRTEARFSEHLKARVAASTGIALHPAAIRSAADAVVEAEQALARAEAAIAALGPDPGAQPAPGAAAAAAPAAEARPSEPAPPPGFELHGRRPGDPDVDDPVLHRPHDVFDETALDRRRSIQQGIAVLLVFTGGGLIALGLGQPAGVAIAAAAIGLVLGVLVLWRGRAGAHRRARKRAESTRSPADRPGAEPASPSATADPERASPSAPEGTEPASPSAPATDPHADREAELEAEREAWLDAVVARDAARDEAEERLRLARNRWRQLAGADADPHRADEVVRLHDPQLAYDARVAEASPTVRTVAAFHRTAQARWRVLWAALGRGEPPEPEALDAILEEVLGDHRRARADLHELQAAEARDAARTVARRPLVLVEPREWIDPGRLSQLLSSIPPEGRAVLVERESAMPIPNDAPHAGGASGETAS